MRKPEVFLFDEPLSNLDAKLRVQMRLELAKLHADLGTTMIYVTHDQTEAMTLADKIVVLDKGTISQVGSPLELYNRPANKFVAAFIGSPGMNFFGVDASPANDGLANVVLPEAGRRGVGLRAKSRRSKRPPNSASGPSISLWSRPTIPGSAFVGAIEIVEHLGNATLLYVDTPAGQLIVQGEGNLDVKPGQDGRTHARAKTTSTFSARRARRFECAAGRSSLRRQVEARCPDRNCRSRGRRY